MVPSNSSPQETAAGTATEAERNIRLQTVCDEEYSWSDQQGQNAQTTQHWASVAPPRPSRSTKQWKLISKYWQLTLVQLLSALYIAVFSYAHVGTFGTYGGFVDPDYGFTIVDASSEERTAAGILASRGAERAIVAQNAFQIICVGITRTTAFFMYPALILVFVTKFRFTLNTFAGNGFVQWLHQDLRGLHVYCGWMIAINGFLHATFHLLRWSNQGNLNLLWEHWSGRSGLVMFISLLIVCIPMMFRKNLRKLISYQARKSMHYFFVVFAVALSLHSTPTSFPNGGFSVYTFRALLGWYFLDSLLARKLL